jgi:hypothetical protein
MGPSKRPTGNGSSAVTGPVTRVEKDPGNSASQGSHPSRKESVETCARGTAGPARFGGNRSWRSSG